MAKKTKKITDKDRLNWLEAMANRKGGLLLHDGSESGRTGLGLKPGLIKDRTLRQAIDQAFQWSDIPKKAKKSATFFNLNSPDA